MRYLSLLSVFIIIGAITADLFLKEPSIWPDEVALAESALRVLKSDSFLFVSWYPPLIIYSLAVWFKLFGLSIISQRLFSLTCGVIFLVVYYLFTKNFSPKNWGAVLAVSALAFDLTFLKATRVSRPEILALLLGFSALLLIRKSQAGRGKLKFVTASTGGLLSALAVFAHPVASFFPLATVILFLLMFGKKVLRSVRFYFFTAFLLIPLAFWVIPMFYSIRGFLYVGTVVSGMQKGWIWLVLTTQPWEFKLVYLLYISITLLFIIYVLKGWRSILQGKRSGDFFLAVVLALSWLFPLYGNEFWYFVYPLPFIYLAWVKLMMDQAEKARNLFYLSLAVLAGLVLLNFKLNFNVLLTMGGDKYSYGKYTEEVLKIIPDKKTVFLSAIPDPYYGFVTGGRENKLIEFPSGPINQQDYLAVLDKVDYVVYNTPEDIYSGTLLADYLAKNKQHIFKVGGASQYQTWVVELKPQGEGR